MRPVDPRLLRCARATRGFLAASVLLGLAGAGLVILQAVLIADVIVGAFVDGHGADGLLTPLALLAAAAGGRALVSWLTELAAHRAAAAVKSELRLRLLHHATADPTGLDAHRTGALTTLATRGVDALDDYFSRYLPQLGLAAVVPAAVLVKIAGEDWVSAATILLTLPLIPLFMVLIGWATQAHMDRQWRGLSRLSGHFLDVVTGLTTLKVFGRAKAQADNIAKITGEYRRSTLRTLRIAFLSSFALELLATISVALVAVSIGMRLVHGELDLHTGLVILILAPEAYLPLRQVGAQYHAAAEGLSAADEVFRTLERETPPAGALSAPEPTTGPLTLDGVTVRYPGRAAEALRGASLSLRPGETVALTGPSGAGKSTVVGVVLGLVRPDEGRVLIGGQDLRETDLASWHRHIAWVPQQPRLFAGTVADNVRLLRPDADDAEVAAALREAAAGGLDPGRVLGEGGGGLSQGQRQRVALARAFLADRPVLLLDEPTAALDGATEAAVVAALRRHGAGRTVLLVTHRAAPLALADRTVTLSAPAGPIAPVPPTAATATATATATVTAAAGRTDAAGRDRRYGNEEDGGLSPGTAAGTAPPGPAREYTRSPARPEAAGYPEELAPPNERGEPGGAEPDLLAEPGGWILSPARAIAPAERAADPGEGAAADPGGADAPGPGGLSGTTCEEPHRRGTTAQRRRGGSGARGLRLARDAGRGRVGRLGLAAFFGAAALAATVGLMAVSGWLISRAWEQPPLLYLMVAVTATRAFGIGRAVFRYVERLLSHDAVLRVLAGLRVTVYRRLERLAPVGLRQARRGDLLARLVGDVDAQQDYFLRWLLPVAAAATVSVSAVAFTAWLVPAAGAALAVGLLCAGVCVPALAAAAASRTERRLAPARGELATRTVDLLTGTAELTVAGALPRRLDAVAATDGELTGIARRTAAVTALASGLTTALTGLTVVATAWLGAQAVASGGLAGVWLATVVLVPLAAFEGVAALPQAVLARQRAARAGERVQDVLDAPDPVAEPEAPAAAPVSPFPLRLRRLTVRHPGTPDSAPDALAGIDLDLTPGRRIAVVGPSGAGKTTLAAALLRLIDPAPGAGRYTLAGVDATSLESDAVRRLVGLCAQDAHLFDSTLRENLRIAAPGAADGRLREALRRARLLEWADGLPEGLDTPIGEDGARLSGGQRQRLALARALLADFPVLILDEPAEHLDTPTADALTADLLAATEGRATVLITHRLAGLAAVDEVLLLDAGRAVARGPYHELAAADGPFRRLLDATADHPENGEKELSSPLVTY